MIDHLVAKAGKKEDIALPVKCLERAREVAIQEDEVDVFNEWVPSLCLRIKAECIAQVSHQVQGEVQQEWQSATAVRSLALSARTSANTPHSFIDTLKEKNVTLVSDDEGEGDLTGTVDAEVAKNVSEKASS